jgi:uncharacterized protein YndB with AHSA1/START domain
MAKPALSKYNSVIPVPSKTIALSFFFHQAFHKPKLLIFRYAFNSFHMKFLKIAGLILGLLMVGIILIGLFAKRFEYSSSITINASPAHCWEVFHDTTQMRHWVPGLKSLTLMQGKFFQAGSVYEMVIEDNGERMVMHETLMAVDPPREISYVLTNDAFSSKYSYRFIPGQDGTTRIESQYEVAGNSLIWRAVLYLSKSYLSNSSQEQLVLFKKHIEQ